MSSSEKPKFRARRNEAGRWRAFETRLWPVLARLDAEALRLLLYLWAGPQSSQFGILYFPTGYALVDLQWTEDQFQRARKALVEADLLWCDGDLHIISCFLQANPPANESVSKGWTKALRALPDSPLYKRLYQHAAKWLTEEGLAFLSGKIHASAGTVSAPSADCVETVSTPRMQGSETRDQEEGIREKEEGVRVQGGVEGAGQGKEPTRPGIEKSAGKDGQTSDRMARVEEGMLNGLDESIFERAGYQREYGRLKRGNGEQ